MDSGHHDLEALRLMLLIRRFEETVFDAYRRGIMPGLAHLSIGQEAVAVGTCTVLRDDDYIVSTHRGHGHCLAKGARPDRMMAEILGRSTGYCRGRGGTMHIADMEHANLGATAIVGASFGLGTGVGLACQRLGQGRVVVAFTGDGAMNEGVTGEAMNLAAIWGLPVVFVCENNQYGEYTASARMTAGSLTARAEGFGVPARRADGMNLGEVRKVTGEAVAVARDGGGPSFIEFETYRYVGHHAGDQQRYRTAEEVEAWRARDPVERLAEQLLADGAVDRAGLEALRAEVADEIARALQFAVDSPFPDPSEVEELVDD
jgi:pyruvate dehydrogenase E1 component alpha subunit